MDIAEPVPEGCPSAEDDRDDDEVHDVDRVGHRSTAYASAIRSNHSRRRAMIGGAGAAVDVVVRRLDAVPDVQHGVFAPNSRYRAFTPSGCA